MPNRFLKFSGFFHLLVFATLKLASGKNRAFKHFTFTFSKLAKKYSNKTASKKTLALIENKTESESEKQITK